MHACSRIILNLWIHLTGQVIFRTYLHDVDLTPVCYYKKGQADLDLPASQGKATWKHFEHDSNKRGSSNS